MVFTSQWLGSAVGIFDRRKSKGFIASKYDAREGDACSGSGWGSSRRLGGGSFGFMFGGEN